MTFFKKVGIIAVILGLLIWVYQMSEKVFLIDQKNGPTITVRISRWEANCLESFFRQNICCDQWAYTMFGYKPISLGGGRFGSSLRSILPPAYSMRKGWKIWQKLQLPHSHFVLWREASHWSKDVDFIFIANKNCVAEILSSYAQDFCELTQKNYSDVDSLLQDIPKKSLINGKLKNQEVLLGILLGYGRKNAYLFCDETVHKDVNIWDPEIEKPIIESCFKKLNTFRDPDISDMLFPRFAADKDSAETIALKQKYMDARQKILDYYKDKPFLETTLSILVNGPPD